MCIWPDADTHLTLIISFDTDHISRQSSLHYNCWRYDLSHSRSADIKCGAMPNMTETMYACMIHISYAVHRASVGCSFLLPTLVDVGNVPALSPAAIGAALSAKAKVAPHLLHCTARHCSLHQSLPASQALHKWTAALLYILHLFQPSLTLCRVRSCPSARAQA